MRQHVITKFKSCNSFHECDNFVCVTGFIDATLSRFSLQIGSVFLNILDMKIWSSSCYCHVSFCRESTVSSLFWYDLYPFEVSIAHAMTLFSLKYYKATTFVESYFLETVKGKLLFMFLWIVFSMQGAIAHFTILGKKIYFLLSKGTFTSVNFTYSS